MTKDKARFHIVLVQGVVYRDGKILIGQRGYDEVQAAGAWSIPGGKVDFYSKDSVDFNRDGIAEETLTKELMEEVGVKIESRIEYLKSGYFIRKDNASVVVLIYLCRWRSGKAKPLEDTMEVRWVSEEELDDFKFAIGVKEILREAFAKFKVS